jgi:hypothetical protein
VTDLSGMVQIQRATQTIPAAVGTAIEVADKITTGPSSHLTVTLSDGSKLGLNPMSTLVLDEHVLGPTGARASTKVSLLGGSLHSIVAGAMRTSPNFEVHTPNAIAGVRGTDFTVYYHPGTSSP